MNDSPLGPTSPLVGPLYQTCVYNLPDLESLDRVMDQQSPGFIYARDGHPNAKSLADKLAELEGAKWAMVTGSGMGALSAAFLATVSSGDRIVASNRLYGKTTKLLRNELARFGVKTVVVDCCDLDAVRESLQVPARVLFVETMSNPMCRTPDLRALADLAHEAGARLVVDNTFATPVLCRPLSLGADLVMESLTKLIGGHSDITLGCLAGNDVDLLPSVASMVSTWGLSANPFDCWLCERSLPTLDLRVRAASENAGVVADWLAGQPNVVRVVYPGRPDHPDRGIAAQLLGGRFGNMLCFELKDAEAANRFVRATPVPLSPSLGHINTTLSHPDKTSHRYDSKAEKARQGITEGLIRLSVGIEAPEQTMRALAAGLSAV